jgi:membrane protease YdiL (CAAX protease family)
MTRKLILTLLALSALALLAEGMILLPVHEDSSRLLLHVRLDILPLAALLESLVLMLAAFVGLTQSGVVRQLRHWAVESAWAAFLLPQLLLVPYLIYALGTATVSLVALGKLVAYIAVPTLLLLPDRLGKPERAGWRDFAAMAALAVPIPMHWLQGIWTLPESLNAFRQGFDVGDLYFFQPLFCVAVGAYAFLAVRNLDGVGYRLLWRRADAFDGAINFVAFSILGIPLGLALQFIHPHTLEASFGAVFGQFVGIYLTIAIPEEFLFRGVLQNFLVRSIPGGHKGVYGLLIASVVFGASHLHHPPVPNWRYAIMATLAGIFYGNAYRSRQRLCASALTHALVDTVWRFWF